MRLPMAVWRPQTLVLCAKLESWYSADESSRGPHAAAEEILATLETVVTARTLRAHAHAQKPSQAQADVQTVRLHHGQRIASCGYTPEVILRQINADFLL